MMRRRAGGGQVEGMHVVWMSQHADVEDRRFPLLIER